MSNRRIKESEGQRPMNEKSKKHEFEAAPAAEAANTDTQQPGSALDAAVPAVDMREGSDASEKSAEKEKAFGAQYYSDRDLGSGACPDRMGLHEIFRRFPAIAEK